MYDVYYRLDVVQFSLFIDMAYFFVNEKYRNAIIFFIVFTKTLQYKKYICLEFITQMNNPVLLTFI